MFCLVFWAFQKVFFIVILKRKLLIFPFSVFLTIAKHTLQTISPLFVICLKEQVTIKIVEIKMSFAWP